MSVNEFRNALHNLLSDATESEKMDLAMIYGILCSATRAIGLVFDSKMMAVEKKDGGA